MNVLLGLPAPLRAYLNLVALRVEHRWDSAGKTASGVIGFDATAYKMKPIWAWGLTRPVVRTAFQS